MKRHPELVGKVVEETLRYDAPIQLTARLATRDTEVAGVSIPRGSIVAVLLASANRDALQFEDPDRFDIDRPEPAHLAFGHGHHFCIGASLARLEGSIALEMILTRLRGLALTVDEAERHGSFPVRGPTALPVRFDVWRAFAADLRIHPEASTSGGLGPVRSRIWQASQSRRAMRRITTSPTTANSRRPATASEGPMPTRFRRPYLSSSCR